MALGSIEKIWSKGIVLTEAFGEYKICLKDVYSKVDKILRSPVYTPEEFDVKMADIPKEFFTLRKNIFSTLFQSMYHLLGVTQERRMLYGKLNHLFRIWVTSADNLLDEENKIVIPMHISENAHIMRQVISIMTADRVMKEILDEGVDRNIISLEGSKILSEKSLQVLLPSAAEEASEESGISRRPNPDYVLYTVHRLKTGILFHIPFLGVDMIEEDVDIVLIKEIKDALDKFGLGCQLLDDIRDMAKDHLEKRHNYVLSMIEWENKSFYQERLAGLEVETDLEARIFSNFPEVVGPTSELAKNLLRNALCMLDEAGLGVGGKFIDIMVGSMFKILGVGELISDETESRTF